MELPINNTVMVERNTNQYGLFSKIFNILKQRSVMILWVIDKLIEIYTWLVLTYPCIVLSVGLCIGIIPSVGLYNYSPVHCNMDAADLMTPVNSRSKVNMKKLDILFSNLSADHFYPHQTINPGYSFVVLLQTHDNSNLLKQSELQNMRDAHNVIKTMSTFLSDGSHLQFQDVCAKMNKSCVIKGEHVFHESFTKALLEGRVSYPFYEGFDLSEVFGNISSVNGTLSTAFILKFTYFVSENFFSSPAEAYAWIREYVKRIKPVDPTNRNSKVYQGKRIIDIIPSHTFLTSADLYNDFPDVIFFLCTTAIFVIFTSLASLFLFGLYFLIVIGVICLSYMGAMALLQLPWCCLPFFVMVVVFDWLLRMASFADTYEGICKVNLREFAKENLVSLIYTSFFSIGITSNFLMIRAVSISICVAATLCGFIGATCIPSFYVIVHKYNKHTVTEGSCLVNLLFGVFGLHNKELEKDIQQKKENIEKSALKRKTEAAVIAKSNTVARARCISLFLFCSILGFYVGSNIYTHSPTSNICDYATHASDGTFSKFCTMDSNYFKQDFIITIVAEFRNVSTCNALKKNKIHIMSFMSTIKSHRFINSSFEINWMTSFVQKTDCTEKDFTTVIHEFKHDNPEFVNDIVFDKKTSSLTVSRFYIKTNNLRGSADKTAKLFESLQLITNRFTKENNIRVFPYAPEFLLYEGILSNEIYLHVSISLILFVVYQFVAFISDKISFMKHMIFFELLVLSVVGFMKFWSMNITHLTSLAVLIILVSIVQYVYDMDNDMSFYILLLAFSSPFLLVFGLFFNDAHRLLTAIYNPICLSLIFAVVYPLIFKVDCT